MTRAGKGFTIVELQVAIAIVTLVAIAATISGVQIMKLTPLAVDRFTAIRHVQNAGSWITRDAEMAENISVGNLAYPIFMELTWMVYGYDGEPSVFHTVTYSFSDVSQGVGKLRRTYSNTAGANEETTVAQYIYYDPADPDSTTKGQYQNPELTVKLTGRFGSATESAEFKVMHRPNTFY